MQYAENTHVETHAKSAGVIILDDESRILLVQEKVAGATGLWHIPAGAVEKDEPLEHAAIREAKEETGLDVELIYYLDTYLGKFPGSDLIARHVWLAQAPQHIQPSPLFTKEIAACQYFSMLEFMNLYEAGKIRMYHTKLMFEDALKLQNILS